MSATQRLVGRAAVATIVAAAVGCGGTDPYAPVAYYTNIAGSFVVYPISSAPASVPTALALYSSRAVRPSVSTALVLNFDLAIDLDAPGRVRLLPPVRVIAPQAGALATGLQIVTGTTFATFLRAPNSGYNFDSATVVTPGQVVAVQTQGAGLSAVVCATTAPMYAKLVVDSIRPSVDIAGSQAIYLHTFVDPNCGFRSLDAGIPTS